MPLACNGLPVAAGAPVAKSGQSVQLRTLAPALLPLTEPGAERPADLPVGVGPAPDDREGLIRIGVGGEVEIG